MNGKISVLSIVIKRSAPPEAKLPFGRLIKPEEVARAVAYLASEESGLMTGSIIDFDQQVLGCAESAPQPPPSLAA